MKTYTVTLPVAGHIIVEVEAENAKAAIDKAIEQRYTTDNIDSWDVLEQFIRGNVCYCPQPWEAEAEPAFGEEPDEDAA